MRLITSLPEKPRNQGSATVPVAATGSIARASHPKRTRSRLGGDGHGTHGDPRLRRPLRASSSRSRAVPDRGEAKACCPRAVGVMCPFFIFKKQCGNQTCFSPNSVLHDVFFMLSPLDQPDILRSFLTHCLGTRAWIHFLCATVMCGASSKPPRMKLELTQVRVSLGSSSLMDHSEISTIGINASL